MFLRVHFHDTCRIEFVNCYPLNSDFSAYGNGERRLGGDYGGVRLGSAVVAGSHDSFSYCQVRFRSSTRLGATLAGYRFT